MRTVPRRASGRYFHTAPFISMCASTPYLLTVEYMCESRLHDSLDFRHDRIRISYIGLDNDFVVEDALDSKCIWPSPFAPKDRPRLSISQSHDRGEMTLASGGSVVTRFPGDFQSKRAWLRSSPGIATDRDWITIEPAIFSALGSFQGTTPGPLRHLFPF
jgi:hypothetical protein